MGLLSAVTKIGSKAVRAAKLMPEFLLGTGSDVVGKGMKMTKGSIWTKVKGGARALEKDIAKKSVQGGFFKRTFKAIISIPKDLIKNYKLANRAAKIAGKGALKKTLGAGLKSLTKTIAKRMPLIGGIMTLAFDGPEIYKSFKNGGIGAGLKETAGVGAELGCMAAGAAIGSIIPGVGTLIGGIAGSLIGMGVRHFCFNNDDVKNKDEAREPIQYSEEEKQQLRKIGIPDEEIEILQQNGVTMEEIAQMLEDQQNKVAQQNDATKVNTPTKPSSPTEPESPTVPTLPTKTETQGQTTGIPSIQTEATTTTKPNPDPYGLHALLSQLSTPSINPLMYQNTQIGNAYSNDLYYTQLMFSNPQMFGGAISNPFANPITTPFINPLANNFPKPTIQYYG